ncbi:hypothetical protein E4T56_gene14094 [Termitomyces sp. T112]|nr:hypothetical protein E4T56_gene14094 [Termitomyces sp. T112]
MNPHPDANGPQYYLDEDVEEQSGTFGTRIPPPLDSIPVENLSIAEDQTQSGAPSVSSTLLEPSLPITPPSAPLADVPMGSPGTFSIEAQSVRNRQSPDESHPPQPTEDEEELNEEDIEVDYEGADVDSDDSNTETIISIDENHSDRHSPLQTPDEIVKETIQKLANYQLLVDPLFNRIICLVCESLVPFDRIHAHAYKHTSGKQKSMSIERRIPSKERLEELLMLLDAHKPVKLGENPIPPFEGISMIQGVKCLVPSCTTSFWIHANSNRFNKHCAIAHPELQPKDRLSCTVRCQALTRYRQERTIQEVTYVPQDNVDALKQILDYSDAIGLGKLPETYVPATNTHARNLIVDYMEWDMMLEGVNLGRLRRTADPPRDEDEPSFFRLQNLVQQYYVQVARELLFILRNLKTPINKFMIHLHSDTLGLFTMLENSLEDPDYCNDSLLHQIHSCIWALLSQPSNKFLHDDREDPFTRFLISSHLKDDHGLLAPPPLFPHNIARAQWCFRATGCWEVIRLSNNSGSSRQMCYETHVRQWIHENGQHLFNSLRQNMLRLTAIAKAQPGIPRFNWNVTKTALDIDGSSILLKSFHDGISSTILRVEGLIHELFQGCPYNHIMDYIDRRMDPSSTNAKDWFKDDTQNEDIKFSIFWLLDNGWDQFDKMLLTHLSKNRQLFQTIRGTIKARAQLWEWFGLLDRIVGLLFCLACTTWGGGARGTECDDLKFANNKDGGRHMFIINNTLTFLATYNKSRNIHGVTRQVAHSPSFRISRLLLLVLGIIYPAAANMAPHCLMDKQRAENYLTYVFVQNGRVMKTDDFSKALRSYTKDILDLPMGMRDWRQVMCTIMVNVGHIDFGIPDDEDEDLKAIHDTFRHSLTTGQNHYTLQINDSLPGVNHTSIASDQRVCFRWHACINQLHPSLASEMKASNIENGEAWEELFNKLDVRLTPLLESLQRKLEDDFKAFSNKMMRRLEDHSQALGPYIAQEVIQAMGLSSAPCPQPRQNMTLVHPNLLSAIPELLPHLDMGNYSWTCPEQAELVQTCLTDDHVLAVLPTGSGKALSFFAAALLYPDHLFLVVIPLTSLVEDMYRRLKQTRISGSIYPKCHPVSDRIVIVPSHLVATDTFRDWSRSINYRLKRTFMDECHQIYTSQYRDGFDLLKALTALGKPITFLSATVFPDSVDLLCRWMEIPRSLLHEIRSPHSRQNIQYHVTHIPDETDLQNEIQKLVKDITLKQNERGLIYCKTVNQVKKLAMKLGFPEYYSNMDMDDVKNKEIKKRRQDQWRLGLQPFQCWMVATMGFGQGIDYPSVRYVIHYDVHGIMHFVQEVGRAGRDGILSYSHVFYSTLPSLVDVNEEPGDHTGRKAMRSFLTTVLCRRLALYIINGSAHSCASLGGAPLCDNCQMMTKSSSLSTLSPPSYSRPLVGHPSSRKRTAGAASLPEYQSGPISTSFPHLLDVENNGRLLEDRMRHAEAELGLLRTILDCIVSVQCGYCWVHSLVDDKPHPHTHHKMDSWFSVWLDRIQDTKFHQFKVWPICYLCWIPFRELFGHGSHAKGSTADSSKCPYHDIIPNILPHIITLILTRAPEKDRMEFLHPIAQSLNMSEESWLSPSLFGQWVKIEPKDQGEIPHHIQFLNAYYRTYKQMRPITAMEVDTV